jgi:sulfofructose kinase
MSAVAGRSLPAAHWDVLGFGAAAVDDLLYVDHFPEPDSKLPVREVRRQGGGQAATALVAAVRLGVSAAYYGLLGDDPLSSFTIGELEKEGVDCAPVRFQAGARPYHSFVIVDRSTAERTILYSTDGVTYPMPAEITPALIGSCRVLFVDHHTAAAGLAALAYTQRAGIPMVVDIEAVPNDTVAELVRRADHLIVGLRVARDVTGAVAPADTVRALVAAGEPGRACCVVTAGAQGCWYAVEGGPVQHLPALAVQAVDTTGCGDVFHGAYAAALARGEPIERALRIATIVAGLKATKPGGRAGIPDWDTVQRMLA